MVLLYFTLKSGPSPVVALQQALPQRWTESEFLSEESPSFCELYSPTGRQRSSSPRCSSPARSAIAPVLPSTRCSALSSRRPPPPRRRRWWRWGQWCSSRRSVPSGPTGRSGGGRRGVRERSRPAGCQADGRRGDHHSPPERCRGSRGLCAGARERAAVATGGTCTSPSGSLWAGRCPSRNLQMDRETGSEQTHEWKSSQNRCTVLHVSEIWQ